MFYYYQKMNERALFEIWKSFASQNNFEFNSFDRHILNGIITDLKITSDNKTIIHTRICKTASAYQHHWTKVFLGHLNFPIESFSIKRSPFDFFIQKSTIKSELRKSLKRNGASELHVSRGKATIIYKTILNPKEALNMAVKLKEKIREFSDNN